MILCTKLIARTSPSSPVPMLTSVRLLALRTLQNLTFPCAGANPSAEEADEGVEDGAITINNVVHSFRLQSTSFDKKSYLTYLKVTRTCFGVECI